MESKESKESKEVYNEKSEINRTEEIPQLGDSKSKRESLHDGRASKQGRKEEIIEFKNPLTDFKSS